MIPGGQNWRSEPPEADIGQQLMDAQADQGRYAISTAKPEEDIAKSKHAATSAAGSYLDVHLQAEQHLLAQ